MNETNAVAQSTASSSTTIQRVYFIAVPFTAVLSHTLKGYIRWAMA
jgi:hypothetical protein